MPAYTYLYISINHCPLFKSLLLILSTPTSPNPIRFPSTAASSQAVPKWLSVPGVSLEVSATDPAYVRLLWHIGLVLPLPHHSHGF